MTLPAPTYDLVLLLDPQAEEATRTKIVADAVGAIQAQGELVRQDGWGERALTYPIDRKASADYHLLQFHVGQTALLEGLDRTLRITDGVLRHRIIKLKPGVGEPPAMAPAPAPAAAQTADVAPAVGEEAPEAPAAEEAVPAATEQPVAEAPAPTAEPEAPAAVEAPAADPA
jgi:small subunit ribosomal protein S6